MKIIKRLLLGIVILVAIVLIAALFINKDYTVHREVVINKPSDSVFNYIRYLKNQNNFSVWAQKDPNMKKTFTGTDGAVGFMSAWEGNKEVGKGEQTIAAIREGRQVDYKLHFVKPMENDCTASMITESAGAAQTKVSWSFNGHSPWPFNFMNLFMDGMLGKDLQTGLNNLKGIMEQ